MKPVERTVRIRGARVPVCLLPKDGDFSPESPWNPVAQVSIDIGCGRVLAVGEDKACGPGVEAEVDLGGHLLLPGWVDAHVHLDKTYTWDRAPNLSGTFGEAISVLGADKAHWTAEDLRRRATTALETAAAHGTAAMRSHVDTGPDRGRASWEVLSALREEWADRLDLQLVSLCGVEDYAGPRGQALADIPVAFGAAALGGMPRMQPDLPGQLDRLMALASERGVGLDLHVDENGEAGSRCLLEVAEAVLRNRFAHPVVCGHCCSLAVQAPEDRRQTMERVKAAGIGIISLPLCNSFLQDRRPASAVAGLLEGGYSPFWRGLTPVVDLLRAGIPVACASDNVRDAFYAYGDYDLAEVWRESVRLAHLEHCFRESLETVTRTPARLMGLEALGIVEPGALARLVEMETPCLSRLLARPLTPRRIWDGEAFIRKPLPRNA